MTPFPCCRGALRSVPGLSRALSSDDLGLDSGRILTRWPRHDPCDDHGVRLLLFTLAISLATPAAYGSRTRDAMAFTATAYCQAGTTASGVHTNGGIVAADPKVLPIGTWIRIS